MTTTPEELFDILKYDITTDQYRDTTYQFNGKLHRDEDQPAVIKANGSKYWYQDGKKHRDEDQPAVIKADGAKFWYKDGNLHRDNDLPAVIYADGDKWWYTDGNRTRIETK